MEHNFIVGDQVKYNSRTGRYLWLNGHFGTIVGFFNQGSHCCVSVEWEDLVYTISENRYEGHNCDGLSRAGYGWNVRIEDLDLFIPEDDCSLEMQGKEFESLI